MTYGPYAVIGSTMPLADDIDFWSRQLSEHMLFMQLGLEDEDLKRRAGNLHRQWESFRRGPKQLQEAILLTRATLVFKKHVYDRLVAGEWLGWLWPLFVDHIRREGEYFLAALEGTKLDPATECKTWMTFMGDHAAFAMHLLDPSETVKIREALALLNNFNQLWHGCGTAVNDQLASLTQRSGMDLDAYFNSLGIGKPGGVKSIIHPVLAEHVVREGRRFLQTMQMLQAPMSPTMPPTG